MILPGLACSLDARGTKHSRPSPFAQPLPIAPAPKNPHNPQGRNPLLTSASINSNPESNEKADTNAAKPLLSASTIQSDKIGLKWYGTSSKPTSTSSTKRTKQPNPSDRTRWSQYNKETPPNLKQNCKVDLLTRPCLLT